MNSTTNQLWHKSAARILLGLGTLALALVPSPALAHDNLGGDELAVANWMLIGAIITIVMGILWGVWAMKTGQFSNVESSKYTMLETAEDYDAIMAEYDAKQKSAQESTGTMPTSLKGESGGAMQPDPALARPATGGTTANA